MPSDLAAYEFQLNKHDQYGNLVINAYLTIESVNHDIDLSGAVVLQNDLPADSLTFHNRAGDTLPYTMITFRTTSVHDAFVYNLPGGTYVITETITPDGYADAAPITFTVADNATEVHVVGTPESEFTRRVLMLDLADPSADQSTPASNTPGNAVPATGEDNTFMVCMAAICIAVSAGITIFVLRRKRSSEE